MIDLLLAENEELVKRIEELAVEINAAGEANVQKGHPDNSGPPISVRLGWL